MKGMVTMGINPGVYREPIEIQRQQCTEDEIGNQIVKWVPFIRVRAYVNNLSGTEYWAAAQTRSENTVMFFLRYCRQIAEMNTKEFQILYRGKEYNVTSVDNVQYKNETVKIRAVMKE